MNVKEKTSGFFIQDEYPLKSPRNKKNKNPYYDLSISWERGENPQSIGERFSLFVSTRALKCKEITSTYNIRLCKKKV